MKKKFARWVTITQAGTPGVTAGRVGTHGCARMNDRAVPVAMNSLNATTRVMQISTIPGSSHHTDTNRDPSRKWTWLRRIRGCLPSSLRRASLAKSRSVSDTTVRLPGRDAPGAGERLARLEDPQSITGLQRVGRAGHRLDPQPAAAAPRVGQRIAGEQHQVAV